ncbi:dihydroxyacetone kinase phosphoryl donor subunit DhaM [Amnibacterium endophyticum]|uniref:Phosphocarrier protein HPr n=1 Tax=Amnibacterium endophyticum TaxID=2109337 RepID=A0ABW4LJ93_9MICO
MGVGLVFVSHSALIAEGLVQLAAQMAPDVRLLAAGGDDDGGIGTSATRVEEAIRAADGGDGVAVLGDLGSAILTAETVVELLDDPPAAGVRVLDRPLAEGGVAAALAAQAGDGLDAVCRAAAGERADEPAPAADGLSPLEREVVLEDPDGLHARPAADLVRTVSGFDAAVTVQGTDARSLLAVLALGLRQGARVRVAATGPDADAALQAVAALLERR